MSYEKVTSAPLKDGAVEQEYNRVGLGLAIFAAFCFFCALWALNGYFTARTVKAIGDTFHLTALSWGVGWLVHLIVSLIEHHLWKVRHAASGTPGVVIVGVYGLIILVGVVDVLTSSLAFLDLFRSVGFSIVDPTTHVVSTVLAEVITILPEPVIVWLGIALWRVVRG